LQETEIRSRHIEQSIKDDVWNRDNGKCVECGSNEKLEFDHIIPFSKGGSNTYRNIQLLCEPCNRTKSDKIG
jgi:5-methylcytosine-specific restriction endonuclease McrA